MNKDVFLINREKLNVVMADNSVLVLYAGDRFGNDDFRINKNFFYATGICEENDILLIVKKNEEIESTLFIKPYDEVYEKWNGKSLTKEEAQSISGIDNVCYLADFNQSLHLALKSCSSLYLEFNRTSFDESLSRNEQLAKAIKDKYPTISVCNALDLFKKCRMIKQEEEIAEIKKAIDITGLGIKEILNNLKPELFEYQLESYFDQAIKFNNASCHAFKTICASGENACCLHYSQNNNICQDKDLLLLDLGACYNEYHADISRTFPVNGKFTPRQKELYDIVLNGQAHCLKFIKPGVTTADINKHLIEYYQEQLMKIGLIKEESEVSKYYYHGVSHHLGLDTHDINDFSPLKEGCVITCEPGLYIKEEKIGIRIEDDILVTKDGCLNLSENILKTTEEIEEFMKKR